MISTPTKGLSSLLSVVLQSRIFQFSDSEFEDPIATSLNILEIKN